MRYFCSTDLVRLNELNSRGLNPQNVTRQWVDIAKHPDRDEWCACIPERYVSRLEEILGQEDGTEVRAALCAHEDLNADGWMLPAEHLQT